MALAVVPSLPHISVVGAVVTGTHGGCINCHEIAGYVTQMKIIDPNGKIKVVNKETPEFKSYLHSFGLLGVITEMTMNVEPEYAVIKCIYEDLPWDFLQDYEKYTELMHSHEFLSFFTDWEYPKMTTTWLGEKVSMDYLKENPNANPCKEKFLGAKLVNRAHPVPGQDPENCVTSGVGIWSEKIYHFLPDKPPSSGGDELQSEFFVPFDLFPEVLGKLYLLQPLFKDVLQITEIRPIKKDDIPLSPAYM